MSGTPAAEISVSIDLVRALIEDQLPQYASLPIRRAGEGWDNFTFRLGDDLAARLPRRAAAAILILNEQLALPRLAARLPLPTPAPVAIGKPGVGYPWSWSIVPWIAGEPSDLAPPDIFQGSILARFLRALHQPADADAPLNPYRGVALADRVQMVTTRLDSVRSGTDLITAAVDTLWLDALAAPRSTDRVWLHGDLHAQNVLTQNGSFAGVIDWGDVCAGDPATDLAAIWGLLPDRQARAAAIADYAPDDELLSRARGWAVFFGVVLYDAGRINNPRHMAVGEAILRRLAADF